MYAVYTFDMKLFFISVLKLLAEIIYHKFLGSVGENDLKMQKRNMNLK